MIKVFISSTSADLGSYREAVKEFLLARGDIQPVEQNSFDPDYRKVRTILNTTIADCDAVICLVGFVYGQEPGRFDFGERRRSYSQMEYDIAKRRHKPLYVFIATPLCQLDDQPYEDKKKEELQHEFREEILRNEEIFYDFSSVNELVSRVSEIKFRAIEPHHEARRSLGRYVKGVLAGVFLGFCAYFLFDGLSQRRREKARPSATEEFTASNPNTIEGSNSSGANRDQRQRGTNQETVSSPPPSLRQTPATASLQVSVKVDYSHAYGNIRLYHPATDWEDNRNFPRANASATMSFTNIPPGEIYVEVRLNDHNPASSGMDDNDTFVRKRVILGAGDSLSVDIPIKYVRLYLTVLPLDAQVSFLNGTINPSSSDSSRDGNIVSGLLRPGLRAIKVSHPDFVEVITNLLLFPASDANFRHEHAFVLQRRESPVRGRDWTAQAAQVRCKWIDGFWLSESEVTIEQFAQYAEANEVPAGAGILSLTTGGWAMTTNTWRQPGFPQTASHPVIGVNWHDAVAFCEWLTREERKQGRLQDNQTYRLPTVSEFRRATEGDSRAKTVGNIAGDEVAGTAWPWPREYSIVPGHDDGAARTSRVSENSDIHPVHGLRGLRGNVSEWTADAYHRDLNTPATRAADPEYFDDKGDGSMFKAVFGPSWADHDPVELDLSVWRKAPSEQRSDRIGFRVVLVENTQ